MTSTFNASLFSQQASGAIHSTEERERGELLFFLNITAFYKVLGGLLGAALLCWKLYINQPVFNDQTLVCEAGIDLIQDPGAAWELLVIMWNSLKENPNQKAINLEFTLLGIYTLWSARIEYAKPRDQINQCFLFLLIQSIWILLFVYIHLHTTHV